MSFFDSEPRLPVRTAVAEEENYDLTFYDCGPGESSESAYETSTDYLDEIDSFVDQDAAEDAGKESYIPKEFGQAFTFNFDDSQTLSSKPAQNVEARDEFFGGSKPSRSSGYISSDSSCSSAESTAFPSDHPIFRFSDQPAEAPLATPVREPTVQPTITEDHHLESVAKELIFSPMEKDNTTTSTKRRSTSFAVPDAAPRPTAEPGASTHSSAPLSAVKKAPAPKAALSILAPKMSFATSAAKKAPVAGAPMNRPKTAPAQTAPQPAPREAPQGGMKRSAEGATNTTSAKPPSTTSTTTTTSKMTTTAKASVAAKDSPQPSLFSPPATTSSFFSSTDAPGDETSVQAINKTAVHFVTPSGPKTSATAEEDHLFAGFSRFSPTPAAAASAAGSAAGFAAGSASSGSERHSASATGIAMLVSPAGSHPTDDDNEPPPYSQQFMPTSSATGAASTADPSTSDAEALQCCEDMGLRVEEGNERLARLKQAEREGRAKMVQKIAETARLQGKFLAMDCMSTLAPLLLDLKLKIDELHLRQKRIEEVRLKRVASLGTPDLPPSHESQRMDTSAVYDEVEQEVQQEVEAQITTEDQQNKSGEEREGGREKVEGWGEENRFELVM